MRLFAYEDDKAYDILLLDVEMGETSGLQLARRVREHGSRAEILFVTSHFEFAGEGYEVDALHYLVKPVEEGKLMEVLSKAAGRLLTEPPSIVITCEGETVKLYEQDIRYMESFGHYIVIHPGDGSYKIKENISAFAEKLSDAFFRTHRSYLVSLQHIMMLYFSMLNTAGKKQKKEGSFFLSRKEGMHGFGLRRVEHILMEHGGWCKYNSEDGAFTSEFLVPALE